MKKIIFILMCTATLSFTQEAEPQKTKKKYSYAPHSIGVETRMGGAHVFSLTKDQKNIGINTRIFDFYVGKRYGKTKYISLLQLRFMTPFLDDPAKGRFMNELRWGFLFGGSQYIFDKRLEDGKGWSMLANGGFIIDFAPANRLNDFQNNLVNLGAELDFKAIYNFQKLAAVTFGMNIGYQVGYQVLSAGGATPDGYPIPSSKGLDILQAFVWGFNIGFLF